MEKSLSSRCLLIFFLRFLNLDMEAKITQSLEFTRAAGSIIKGCWKGQGQAETVSPICFYMSERLMRITYNRNGRTLAIYHTNKEKDIQYLQFLGAGLLRHKAVERRVPMFISRSLARKIIKRKFKELSYEGNSPGDHQVFVKEILRSTKHGAYFKRRGRRSLTENEVVTLEKISATLSKYLSSSHLSKVMERCNLFFLGLIRSRGPLENTPKDHFMERFTRNHMDYEVNVVNRVCPSGKSHKPPRGTGYDSNIGANKNVKSHDCEDMRNGSDQECFGMCGKKCWCWHWVCGDCCLHKGCLQHDACCRYANPQYLSTYCLLPFVYGFNCENGYPGYPTCLYR